MDFNLKTTKDPDDPARFVAQSILNQLKMNKRVLFFVTGGSSIDVGVRVSEILQKNFKKEENKNLVQNLTIALTDERHGRVGHPDSNWKQLLDKGFSLLDAKIIPVLTGDELIDTTQKFNMVLTQAFKNTDYKIGLFGIGADGHTAGILPESKAVNFEELVVGYEAPKFSRITITPKAIEQLDEAVVWAQGEEKWNTIQNFINTYPLMLKQPAQVLKKVPLLTIFTDFKK
ncbi:6-phosphogluconolactonase [Candidatus Nomurabacteria bacterium]|nr:6-phosphogluconolactonase [Candidatus Nomurabacteria bacterium]